MKVAGLYLLYFAIAFLSGLLFWVFQAEIAINSYIIFFFWIVNPGAILVISLLISKSSLSSNAILVFSPIIFGIVLMGLGYFTFDLANMISFEKINQPSLEMFVVGFVLSLLGGLVGKIRTKK